MIKRTAVFHYRLDATKKGRKYTRESINFTARGGVTVAFETVPKDDGSTELHVGVARCDISDSYVKSIGAAKALGRAKSDMERETIIPNEFTIQELGEIGLQIAKWQNRSRDLDLVDPQTGETFDTLYGNGECDLCECGCGFPSRG